MRYDKMDDNAADKLLSVVFWVIMLLGLIVISFTLLSGETPTVGKATAFGQLATYEEMTTGAVRVWLQGNDTAVYCTTDPKLIKMVKEYGGESVIVEYIPVLEPECVDHNINNYQQNHPQKTTYQLTAITKDDH